MTVKPSLSGRNDLTRWNRAGLRRFRYIDANAITHLQTLRDLLQERFPGIEYLGKAGETSGKESTAEVQRWLDQYHADRRDYGWEILRTYARACHVLTEYINAYANECYLETATEWENVRRLVGMLGYQPAPPASAETWLALEWEKDAPPGKIKAGFAVQNQPAEGEDTITYETLEDLEGDATLNELFPKDWNKSQKILSDSDNEFLFEYKEGIVANSVGVLVCNNENKKYSKVKIKRIQTHESITVETNGNFGDKKPSDLRLLINPAYMEKPLPYGDGVFKLEQPLILTNGGLVILESREGKRIPRWVKEKRNSYFSVSPIKKITDIKKVYIAHKTSAIENVNFSSPPCNEDKKIKFLYTNVFFFPKNCIGAWVIHSSSGLLSDVTENIKDYCAGHITAKLVDAGNWKEAFYILDDDYSNIEKAEKKFCISGKATALIDEKFILAKSGSDYSILSILKTQQNANDFEIIFDNYDYNNNIEVIFTNFQDELKPLDHNKNNNPTYKNTKNYSTIILERNEENFLNHLSTGRKVLIEGEGDTKLTTIHHIDNNTIFVQPPLPNDSEDKFPCYSTRIYANVVKAGHGETQPEYILGSGDAAEINQRFHLDVEDVSFVADANFASGVRADLKVKVDERIWKQIPDLGQSVPEEHHYQVMIREDHTIDIQFGDGVNGRRLPTGFDNVRVRYRTGNGKAGNLKAGKLTEIVQPHSLIKDVKQPLAASGGNDIESVESMRSNAPASVLTLERAVSLSDFTHLATRHSSVLQAQAFPDSSVMPGRPAIKVVVVPPDGKELGKGLTTIEDYLEEHAIPGTSITVENFIPILLKIHVTLQIMTTAWQEELVKAAVKKLLLDKLSIENRKLGQSLFRSEVVGWVEQVQGVENCSCTISTKMAEKRLTVSSDELLYLPPDTGSLTIDSKEYQP